MSTLFSKILVVDDDEDVLHALRLLLKKHSRLVHTEKNPEHIPTLLKNEDYDLILLDMNFKQDVTSGREGFFWLDKILEVDPSAVVVLITAYGDVETAVRAIKEGATDFVLKPWQNERLLATLSSAMKLRQSRRETTRLRSRQRQLSADLDVKYQDFVGGAAPSMRRVFETIDKVAGTDASILILGENGTGKELVARALHRASTRRDDVFVTVDMGAIPETLFESELFGHVKGAFTDAKEDRAGRFEVASGGTLFLDEIGNLSLPLQAKILTAIQRREVTRVGSNKSLSTDVRLVCATNMPIYEMVQNKTFRQDLLYRINTVEIRLPPLRERPEDIPLLVDHFLDRYARKYQKSIKGVQPAALKKMEKYHWPGNIRELEHMIERAIIMTESSILQPEDFFFAGHFEMDDRHDGLIFDSYNLEEVEKMVIRKALDKRDGNISQAAHELGLTRASLYRRLEKYGL
ncbi:MAG: sigma-54-dependent transcriptional regulator [Rhodothermales bacterium]